MATAVALGALAAPSAAAAAPGTYYGGGRYIAEPPHLTTGLVRTGLVRIRVAGDGRTVGGRLRFDQRSCALQFGPDYRTLAFHELRLDASGQLNVDLPESRTVVPKAHVDRVQRVHVSLTAGRAKRLFGYISVDVSEVAGGEVSPCLQTLVPFVARTVPRRAGRGRPVARLPRSALVFGVTNHGLPVSGHTNRRRFLFFDTLAGPLDCVTARRQAGVAQLSSGYGQPDESRRLREDNRATRMEFSDLEGRYRGLLSACASRTGLRGTWRVEGVDSDQETGAARGRWATRFSGRAVFVR
jgi:hypothetical protein